MAHAIAPCRTALSCGCGGCDAHVVQPRDLSGGQAEDLRKNLLGVTPEYSAPRRRPARIGWKRRCCPRGKVTTPRVIDVGKHRVCGSQVTILSERLVQALIRSPTDPACFE